MAGKGSKQRPTDQKKFESNWDVIFGKKQQPETVEEICSKGMEHFEKTKDALSASLKD